MKFKVWASDWWNEYEQANESMWHIRCNDGEAICGVSKPEGKKEHDMDWAWYQAHPHKCMGCAITMGIKLQEENPPARP